MNASSLRCAWAPFSVLLGAAVEDEGLPVRFFPSPSVFRAMLRYERDARLGGSEFQGGETLEFTRLESSFA